MIVTGIGLVSIPPVEVDVTKRVVGTSEVNEGLEAKDEAPVGFDIVAWDEVLTEELPNPVVESEEVVHQYS